METIIHGETLISKIKALPALAKKKKAEGVYQIIANSEVSGNHHVIDVHDGVEFFEKDGTLYLKNDTETQVRCLIKERHDNITIDPGTWKIDFQQEYDYISQEKRNVAD